MSTAENRTARTTNLFKMINSELEEYRNQRIQIVRSLWFSQFHTINRIYYYYNSQFLTGGIDEDADKKYFFNICRNPVKVTTKAIDFDTKNISIQTASGGTTERTWYFEKDLKFWMKDIGFGLVLNRLFAELPIFGSVVLKVIDNKPHFIDLRNFALDKAADNLNNSNFITEIHNLTPIEFEKEGKNLGWDNVEETLKEHRSSGEPFIRVYERYGELEHMDEKGNKTFKYKRIYLADPGRREIPENQIIQAGDPDGLLLEEKEVEGHPYYEFHLEKINGRWLGVGIVETLFDTQIRYNELANQLAKSTYWSSLRIFQSADDSVNINLSSEVEQGQVIVAEDPITPIDMSDRNLAYFNQEFERYKQNRDELTFAFDVNRGERLPAGTPLGSARLAASMSGSHFDQIRETIAMQVKELLYKVIIPNFQKTNNAKHSLRLVGEDLDKLQAVIIGEKVTNSIFDFLRDKGKVPSFDQAEVMKTAIGERVKQNKETLVEIPASFYDDLKYKIDILITGEQKDAAAMSATYFSILQAVTADPTMLTDPRKKKILSKVLENAGINPLDIEPQVEPPSVDQAVSQIPNPRGAGGGVSRPTAIPTQGSTPQQI